jgi:hypothetical protein
VVNSAEDILLAPSLVLDPNVPIPLVVDCIGQIEVIINVKAAVLASISQSCQIACFSVFLPFENRTMMTLYKLVRGVLGLPGVTEISLFDSNNVSVALSADMLPSLAPGASFHLRIGKKKFLLVDFSGKEKAISWASDGSVQDLMRALSSTFSIPSDVDLFELILMVDKDSNAEIELASSAPMSTVESNISPAGAVHVALFGCILVQVCRIGNDHRLSMLSAGMDKLPVVSLLAEDDWTANLEKVHACVGAPRSSVVRLFRRQENSTIESLPVLSAYNDLRMWDVAVIQVVEDDCATNDQAPSAVAFDNSRTETPPKPLSYHFQSAAGGVSPISPPFAPSWDASSQFSSPLPKPPVPSVDAANGLLGNSDMNKNFVAAAGNIPQISLGQHYSSAAGSSTVILNRPVNVEFTNVPPVTPENVRLAEQERQREDFSRQTEEVRQRDWSRQRQEQEQRQQQELFRQQQEQVRQHELLRQQEEQRQQRQFREEQERRRLEQEQQERERERELERQRAKERVLSAIFRVDFPGHPMSPFEVEGVFRDQSNIRQLSVLVCDRLDLPESAPLRVCLQGSSEDITMEDIRVAAASATEFSVVGSQSAGSDRLSDSPVSETATTQHRLPLVNVHIDLIGFILVGVATVPFSEDFCLENRTRIACESKLVLLNSLEPIDIALAQIKAGLTAVAGLPQLGSALYSLDSVLVTDVLVLRNGDVVVIKCYPDDSTIPSLESSRQNESLSDYELTVVSIKSNTSVSTTAEASVHGTAQPPSMPRATIGSPAVVLPARDDASKNCEGPQTTANPPVQASLYERVVGRLAEYSVKLAPSKVLDLCKLSSSVEQAIERFWSNPTKYTESTEEARESVNKPASVVKTKLYQDIEYAMNMLGVFLTEASIMRLTQVSSSVDGAQEYYFCNPDRFESLDLSQVNVPQSSATSLSGAPAPVSASVGYSPLQSSKSSSTQSSPRNKTPLYLDIEKSFTEMGIHLSDASITKLSLSSSSADGALNYYWNNPDLFDNNVTPVVSLASTPQRTAGAVGIPAAYYEPATPIQKDCVICQDSFAISDLFTVECKHSHRFCFGCLVGYLQTNVVGDADTQPHIPACPLANMGSDDERCNHLLSETEISQVVELAAQQGDLDPSVAADIKRRIGRLYVSKGYRDNNCIRCVGCSGDDDNSFWFQLEQDQQTVRCPRSECSTEFCSKCRRTPSHYACDCGDVMAYSRAWLTWTSTGRDEYINAISARNQELSREREQAIAAHRAEVEAAENRFRELAENENYKAQHCKYCPSCKRVVEKVRIVSTGENW